MIDEKLIFETKGEIKKYSKGEVIVREGEMSQYFYYLLNGELSVFNLTEDGKEFLQHKVPKNSFFAEPAVLLELPLPGNVEISSDHAEVLKIKRENFLQFMRENPEKMLEFTKSVAAKALGRTKSLKNIVFLNPEDRIYHQLCDFKKERGNSKEKMLINLTRKELSNMTGLRIETIIRTVKKMEKDGKLEIKSGKVYF